MGVSAINATVEPMEVDVLIVGAGFAGINALHTMWERGYSAVVLEAGHGVGGTWYWNRYPGARVDIESMEYSYGFSDAVQQEWSWSEKYASQAEVERYLNWVTDRLDLWAGIRLGARVTSLTFDEADGTWTGRAVRTGHDEFDLAVRARFVVLATGFLSVPNLPKIPGIETFAGELIHAGAWPEPGPDLQRKRVGVIGTGASGVQIVQEVCKVADRLTVFQRTANWCFPLRNRPIQPEYEAFVKENYEEIRRLEHESRGPGMVLMDGKIVLPESRNTMDVNEEERVADFQWRWEAGGVHMGRSFADLVRNREANDALREFLTVKIREQVSDPRLAEKLIPAHPPLSRRPPGESGYYAAYNRDNVELADVRENPISRILPEGVELSDGTTYPLDTLIFATGFDSGTGAATRVDIRGRDGLGLAEHWSGGARTFLGLMVAGFPNLFLINGPQSPAVHFSPPLLANFQSQHIVDLMALLGPDGDWTIETTGQAESDWLTLANEVYAATLIWETDSWWVGANIPGKPRQALAYGGGFVDYRRRVEEALETRASYRLEPTCSLRNDSLTTRPAPS